MRPRLTCMRSLTLIVPLVTIEGAKLGLTVQWRIRQGFMRRRSPYLETQSRHESIRPATVIAIDNGSVTLSILLKTRTYVRYRS